MAIGACQDFGGRAMLMKQTPGLCQDAARFQPAGRRFSLSKTFSYKIQGNVYGLSRAYFVGILDRWRAYERRLRFSRDVLEIFYSPSWRVKLDPRAQQAWGGL